MIEVIGCFGVVVEPEMETFDRYGFVRNRILKSDYIEFDPRIRVCSRNSAALLSRAFNFQFIRENTMSKTLAYAAHSATAPLAPFSFVRREPLPRDVQLDILFCGVCHSDLHFARNEWKMTAYPCVPGHEIVGRVTKIGGQVKKFKVGDAVGV